MNKNIKATKQFGLTITEAQNIEKLVLTVPAELASLLRFALVIGVGEMSETKPFQTIASKIIQDHSEGVEK
jgi:hypothetical protein